MGRYYKDFRRWAEVAEKVEELERIPLCKSGVVHWCYAGVNVGSEEDGKGDNFTRPALILKTFGDRLVLVVFTTSRNRAGKYYYPLVVGGVRVSAILNQIKVVDRRRIRDFVDEISEVELKKIRLAVANLIL